MGHCRDGKQQTRPGHQLLQGGRWCHLCVRHHQSRDLQERDRVVAQGTEAVPAVGEGGLGPRGEQTGQRGERGEDGQQREGHVPRS